jgi:hypothetical protein
VATSAAIVIKKGTEPGIYVGGWWLKNGSEGCITTQVPGSLG